MPKKILSKDKKGRLFMKIKTKDILKDKEKRCCPPHKLPHTLLGKKVIDEPCHIHKSFLRKLHYKTFCKLLKCPHYKEMIKANDIL